MWFDGKVFGANTDESPDNPQLTKRVRREREREREGERERERERREREKRDKESVYTRPRFHHETLYSDTAFVYTDT